ncbi:MAG: hypothetical protein CR996_01755 [Draconibacterium sp.]|nr:MAG: hypothetical protein CR996_01755 [Draconibacterium sp.]
MKYFKPLVLFTLLAAFLKTACAQDEIDILIFNKKYNEAIAMLDQKLANNAQYLLYLKKGLIYSQLQDYQNAVSAFYEALRLNPENPDILAELAENLSIIGNQQDAVDFYKKAIQLVPDNLSNKAKLGRVYINQKKYKLAYNLFYSIYSTDSSNIYWNKQLAFCSFKTGKRLEAVHLYEKVLEANPRDYITYSNLIHAYDRNKEKEKIVKVLEQGLQQFPNDDKLLLENADFRFKMGEYELARKFFEEYFVAGGDTLYKVVMNYAISTYFSAGTSESLPLFEKLYVINPNDPFTMFYMALIYKKMTDYEKSEKFLQWAIEASVPGFWSKFYHHLGQVYGLSRKFPESIEALKKANELDPDNFEILFEIATTYEEYNANKTLALNYYRLYIKEAGEKALNLNYALNRMKMIKEEQFFNE